MNDAGLNSNALDSLLCIFCTRIRASLMDNMHNWVPCTIFICKQVFHAIISYFEHPFIGNYNAAHLIEPPLWLAFFVLHSTVNG